ncbi:MAG: TonB-dependent receptor [Hyphomicrobiales bacterium]
MLRTILTCLLVLFSSIVFGQFKDTIQLKTVNVVAKKELKETAVNKTKVNRLALLRTIDVSLSELLTEATPVFVKTYGRGSTATVSFRGAGASHTNVLWNGINLNSPMLGVTDVSLIPVYFIDDLDLLHGSSSLTEGSGGFGGSILVSNKADWSKGNQLSFIQGIGSYNTYDEFLSFKTGSGRLRSSTRLFYSDSKNNFEYEAYGSADPSMNGKKIQDNAAYKKYGGLQELYWMASEKDLLSLKLWSQYNRREIPSIIGTEDIDQDNYQIDKNTYLTFDWKHFFSDQSYIKSQAGYLYNEMLYYLAISNFSKKKILIFDSRSYTNSAIANLEYGFQLNDKFQLNTKLDYRFDDVSITNIKDNTGYKASRSALSLRGQALKKFGDRWAVNLLVRIEYVKNNDNIDQLPVYYVDAEKAKDLSLEFIPSLGIEYLLHEDLSWYLTSNISKNYHFPTLNELYFIPGGNPTLRPEKGWTYEIGTKLKPLSRDNTSIDLSFNGYYSLIDDWIVWIQKNQYSEAKNLKEVLISGIESIASWKLELDKWKFKVHANYALTLSTNKTDSNIPGDLSKNKQLPYIPKHSISTLSVVDYLGYSVSYNMSYFSQRFTTSANLDSKRNQLPGVYQHDLAFKKDFVVNKKMLLGLQFKVNNLLDQQQETILRRPMPGRYYTVLLKLKLNSNND